MITVITNYHKMTSIYIPRIGINTDEISLQIMFDQLLIGSVSRVDFVQIEDNARFKKAFVHLSEYYDTEIAYDIKDSFYNDKPYHLYPDENSRVYWILLKNKSPIPETTLNVHQLAENHRILEAQVWQQAGQIDILLTTKSRMTEQIDRMTEQIERLQQTVEQLVGYVDMSDKKTDMFRHILYDNGALANKEHECLFHAYEQEFNEYYSSDDDEMPALIPIEAWKKMQIENPNTTHIVDEPEIDLDDDGFTKC